MERDGRGGWRRRGSTRWISGWRCCGGGWRRVTSGWMRFWRVWKNRRKKGEEKEHEQIESEDRRRQARDRDEAVCRFAGGGVPRAYRSKDRAEMDAGARRMDDASVHQ